MATRRGNSKDNALHGTNETDFIFGFAGNDTLYGKIGNDGLYGGNSNDKLYGQAGNDVLTGGLGDDKMYGGTGDDVFFSTYPQSDAQQPDGGNDKFYGQNGDDVFAVVDGSDGNDIYDGGRGSDTLFVLGSKKSYSFDINLQTGQGAGRANGETYKNIEHIMVSGKSNFDLTGNDGNNFLGSASTGNNNIDGGKGNDIIYSGEGKNVVHGGAGKDTFLFDEELFSNTNSQHLIDDFKSGTDKIAFDSYNNINSFNDLVVSHQGEFTIISEKTGGGRPDFELKVIGDVKASDFAFDITDAQNTVVDHVFDLVG